jgi:phenylalanyl-tRNA synthetase alpha subunit
MTDLAKLELDLINAIGSAETAAAVEELRVAALGKSGSISGLLKGMGALSPDERREQGRSSTACATGCRRPSRPARRNSKPPNWISAFRPSAST